MATDGPKPKPITEAPMQKTLPPTGQPYWDNLAQKLFYQVMDEIFDEVPCGTNFHTKALINCLPTLKGRATRTQAEVLRRVLNQLAREDAPDNRLITRDGHTWTVPAA